LKYIIKLFVLDYGSTRLGCWLGSSRSSARLGRVERVRQPERDGQAWQPRQDGHVGKRRKPRDFEWWPNKIEDKLL